LKSIAEDLDRRGTTEDQLEVSEALMSASASGRETEPVFREPTQGCAHVRVANLKGVRQSRLIHGSIMAYDGRSCRRRRDAWVGDHLPMWGHGLTARGKVLVWMTWEARCGCLTLS
jgi:hypothetical protein